MKTTTFKRIQNITARCVGFFVIFSFVISPIASVNFAYAEKMASGSYTMQSDSMNFEGASSNSSSYSLTDTSGEIATGNSQSANNNLHAGFEQADAAAQNSTSTPTTTPSTGGGNGGGGSSSGSPATYSPANVVNFTATAAAKGINLSWLYPQGADIASVRIVRSDKFFPNDISDGDVIFEGSAIGANGSVIDHDVQIGVRYYYALFAKNSHGDYSSGVLAQARIAPPGETKQPLNSNDIFTNIPQATNVDARIAALTLFDFDFIQDGIKIEHAVGNIVPIDGKKNLTIQLKYDKVPEILKTIAITLTDPDDSSKVFSFLLRVNKDKTAYEATIAPLGKSGEYKLNAIILDYKNQGLKKLAGSLRALVLEEGQSFFGLDGKNPRGLYMMLIFLLVAFLAILALVAMERRKKAQKEPAPPNNLPL